MAALNKKRMMIASIAIVASIVLYIGWKFTSRGAYESAEYRVLRSDGVFECREYPELTLATTSMRFASQGDDGSFMRLFRFISGANQQETKVAMTIPVFMEQDAHDSTGQMGFVMPREVAHHGVPVPADEMVRIRKRAGGRFAVMRFSGRIGRETVSDSVSKLREWMAAQGMVGADVPEVAGYDAPWTPGPFRRNEVLIRLDV